MKSRCLLTVLLACSLACGAASCSLHRVEDAVEPPVPVPRAFSDTGRGQSPGRWWEHFEEGEWDRLVDQALSGNLTLRQAAARLEEAYQAAQKAGAGLWPQVSAEAGASRARTTAVTFRGDRVKATSNLFSLTLAASYEIDLWRRIHSLRDAASLDATATREDFDAAAVTLAANVGETWYSIVEQRAQLALLRDQIKTTGTFLDLVELRFRQGQASALDVYQQRTQAAAVRGQLPVAQSRLEVLEHGLAVLLGKPPLSKPAGARAALPQAPPLPRTGLPADLVARRPDVRAAHARLVAADHRVAAAVADRLPALRLTGRRTNSAAEPGDVFSNWVWSVAGNLVQPVFEAGRRQAEVARTRAAKAALLNAYGAVVLRAFQEVEDALSRERHQRLLVANLEEQVRLARATLEQARDRYVNGLCEYLPVLAALQAQQGKERELLRARRQIISYRIHLYRGLGGAWPRDLDARGIRVPPDFGEAQ